MPFDAVDPVWLAMSHFRRGMLDSAISKCDALLEVNQLDSAVWLLKCRALTKKDYMDDAEMEDEGVGELLLDETGIQDAPRPGTSIRGATGKSVNQSVRPMSGLNRPLTGFLRPGSSSRPSSGQITVDAAFQSDRGKTARPITALGREVRLGTASIASAGDAFINVSRIDFCKFSKRGALARGIADYLHYRERNARAALEMCGAGSKESGGGDWWWLQRLGKCYYRLGLLYEARDALERSLAAQSMVETSLQLAKVFLKLDQPASALRVLRTSAEEHPQEERLHLGVARVHDLLFETEAAVAHYRRVLDLDAGSVEAISCIAAHYFYSDRPEVALRFYRRLLQMGVNCPELYCNLGLCCFYAAQYDMTVSAFTKALRLASDAQAADVWYNIGQLAVYIGDIGTAQQAFRVATSLDAKHAESFTNLGVLEQRKGRAEQARAHFATARDLAPYLFEPFYNGALLAHGAGDYQEAFRLVDKALELYPQHHDSKELRAKLDAQLRTM